MRTAAASQDDEDPLMARLAEFTERGDVVSLEELELSQPFSQRVLVPILQAIGEFSSRFTPQKVLEQTDLKMELAGNPIRVDASTFLASRFIVAGLFGGFLDLDIHNFSTTLGNWAQLFWWYCSFTVLGFSFPQLWLQSKINTRQKEIRKAMPDALDLLTICVEAGIGF